MRQLLLELEPDQPQTLADFVVGQNPELMQRLAQFGALDSTIPAAERFIYLWGAAGCGKTHLLRALANSGAARYVAAAANADSFTYAPGIQLYLLDDCDQLAPPNQIHAFALFNQVRENNALLVTAGTLPPAQLALREDLRTRLGWGLVYQLHGLSDHEKIAALTLAAANRGLSLAPGVLPYLITHFRRDMRSLSAMLDALDRYSLETQRPITLPLLRHLLQLDHQPPTAPDPAPESSA